MLGEEAEEDEPGDHDRDARPLDGCGSFLKEQDAERDRDQGVGRRGGRDDGGDRVADADSTP